MRSKLTPAATARSRYLLLGLIASAALVGASVSASAQSAAYCDQYARTTANRNTNTVGNVVGGAAVGAIGGAIIGSIVGNSRDARRGAAIGAGVGAVGGAAKQGQDWNAVYRAAYNNCMYSRAQPVNNRPEPWSDAWYDYCASKYRSFNPADGTYQPYNGPRQLCR